MLLVMLLQHLEVKTCNRVIQLKKSYINYMVLFYKIFLSTNMDISPEEATHFTLVWKEKNPERELLVAAGS